MPRFTHAAVTPEGRVDHLRQDAAAPEGLSALPLPEPLHAWPQPPSPQAQLWIDAAGLLWVDPRTPAELADQARTRRDAELAACDWRVTRALEAGQAVPQAWVTYRQQLRDVPLQSGFPQLIDWPHCPES